MTTPSPFLIRRATQEDIGALADIYDGALAKTAGNILEAYQDNKDTALDHFKYDMAGVLVDPQKHVDMACVDDIPQAFIVYSIPPDKPYATAELLYNASGAYSFGAILLDHAKTAAQENGKDALLLDGIVPHARSVYAAMGFTQDMAAHDARRMACSTKDAIQIKRDYPGRLAAI